MGDARVRSSITFKKGAQDAKPDLTVNHKVPWQKKCGVGYTFSVINACFLKYINITRQKYVLHFYKWRVQVLATGGGIYPPASLKRLG
ncbi:MAG: hypothetical protein A2Y23_06500 [Clostridiales bacterium GWB2_37_7]|nr:MAG: hypothetical protein A2Y23_06500 [Clostridiales bacterium GWB2_37_7]